MKSEKQLYQWDTNQSLVELTPSAQFVDYPIGDEVIRIKAEPSGRTVFRCFTHQNRQIMSTPQKNAPHSKP